MSEELIAAYLRELAGKKARRDDEGAKLVEAELKALGWKPASPAKRAEVSKVVKEER